MTTEPAFDPIAPLPGPPEPWAATDTPSRRAGPPYHMTDMISAEPAIARRIVEAQADADSQAAALAAAIRETLDAGLRVIITGCGTSEHGALAATEILREATGSAAIDAAQAFELALAPPSDGLVIGISHEGATTATNAALDASRAAGARTALITVTDRSPGGALADVVVETHELDQSWCHTVGYLSPVVAAATVAGHLTGRGPSPGVLASLLDAGLTAAAVAAAESIAASLADVSRIVVVGSGADRIAGRELTLKVEEGAWMPAAYRDLETFLHGHLAAMDERTAVVAIATDRRADAARVARLRGVFAAAAVVGMPTAAILTAATAAGLPATATSVGRIVVPDPPADLPAPVASLVATATPLQLLTERLARARGTDPDPIHRDVDRYREAADAADAAG